MNDYQKLASHFTTHRYKKVCIITTVFPPYPSEATKISIGGAAIDLVSMAQVLRESGFDVSIVALDFVTNKGHRSDPVYVSRVGSYIPYSMERNMVKNALRFLLRETLNPLVLRRLLSALIRQRPDVIVLGQTNQLGLAPHIASKILGIPLYLRCDWSCPSYPERNPCDLKYRIRNCGNCLNKKNGLRLSSVSKFVFGIIASLIFVIKMYIWRRSTGAIAASNFNKKRYEDYGMAPEKILTIHPYRQLAKIPAKSKTSNVLRNDKSLKILFVGRLSKEKGVLLLLNAFQKVIDRHDNVKLMVAGDGPLRPIIERFSRRYPDHVLYMGWLGDIELSQTYQVADVVIIPSIVPESHPIVAEEAIQFDKPVIGFGFGGLKEILREYPKAIIVDKVDSGELTETIITFLSNKMDIVHKNIV